MKAKHWAFILEIVTRRSTNNKVKLCATPSWSLLADLDMQWRHVPISGNLQEEDLNSSASRSRRPTWSRLMPWRSKIHIDKPPLFVT
jgi:hypothetical protein